MPKKAQTICNSIGCTKLTDGGYCDEHKHDVDNEYRKTRTDIREQKFYKSKEWKKLREHKRSINPLCEECLLVGMATPMDVADHIIEIKDDWSRRLDLSNLMSLCYECHNVKTAKVRKERNNKW